MQKTSKPILDSQGKQSGTLERYHFTDEEREWLQDILDKWKSKDMDPEERPQRIEEFISKLEERCEMFLKFVINPNDLKLRKDSTKKALSALKKAQSQYLKICEDYRNNPTMTFSHEVDRIVWSMGENKTMHEIYTSLGDLIMKVENDLVEVKKLIKTGRQKADFGSGLAHMIADSMAHCLHEKPTAYMDGLFTAVVEAVFDILQLESKDPGRLVKAAVDRFSKR